MADSRTCIVQFYARGKKWAHVTAASSTFEAARTAYAWFTDPYWRGPRPTPETVFEISLVGDERKWNVRVGTALKQQFVSVDDGGRIESIWLTDKMRR